MRDLEFEMESDEWSSLATVIFDCSSIRFGLKALNIPSEGNPSQAHQ